MNLKDNNTGESLTPRTDADDRAYPLPEYAQRIQFEGAAHVVMSPEAYEALYDHTRQLECKLQQAKAAREADQATIGKLREKVERFRYWTNGLLQDLPKNRDWLAPETENNLRDLAALRHKEDEK